MRYIDTDFSAQPTEPFRPLEQLMAVFPASSRSHVPPAWQDLMTDPNSPIIDFYPTDFKVDLNGKRFAWMGVALLPLVDELRLLRALDTRRHLLSTEEVERNIRGPDRLFVKEVHPVAGLLLALHKHAVDLKLTPEYFVPPGKHIKGGLLVPDDHSVLDSRLTQGISGRFWPDLCIAHMPGERVPSGVPTLLPDLPVSRVVSVCFADPAYPDKFVFPSKLLDKVSNSSRLIGLFFWPLLLNITFVIRCHAFRHSYYTDRNVTFI
ncbi:unnamed protein product [Protopolystoma xenopodis]|uniref:Xrn1 helical domain-containing protein n=1 Tax=Protopolystoma xenopodis TaxID=117903 RepID=A0A3S5FDX6_9PLAT|nr:unnamed protein product [Protopolystoma xenopodis]